MGTGAVEQHPLVTRREPEQLADLLGIPALDIAQSDDLLLTLGELVDRPAEDRARLGGEQALFREVAEPGGGHTTLRSPPRPEAEVGYRPQRDKTRIEKAMQALARTRLGGWLFINAFPIIDRRLIPLSRGRLKVAMGQPILLLHTRGARSGRPRTTPLLYTRSGDGFLVVASKARRHASPRLVSQHPHPSRRCRDRDRRRLYLRPPPRPGGS